MLDHWSSDNSCDGVHYVGALSISFPVLRHSSAINTKKKVAQRCSPIAMQATRRTHRNFKCEVCKPCWTEKMFLRTIVDRRAPRACRTNVGWAHEVLAAPMTSASLNTNLGSGREGFARRIWPSMFHFISPGISLLERHHS